MERTSEMMSRERKAMAIINIKDITLENGNATNCTRTMMSETGFPANTQVEFIETQSRWTGTGYKNSIYRVVGTDDAIIILHNNGTVDNLSWDSVRVKKGYFAERRSYGQRVGALARKYRLPFELCLALGDRENIYPWFLSALTQLGHVTVSTVNDLWAGINRRKAGLRVALGDDLYDAIGIDKMGQQNSTRIAEYVAKRIEESIR